MFAPTTGAVAVASTSPQQPEMPAVDHETFVVGERRRAPDVVRSVELGVGNLVREPLRQPPHERRDGDDTSGDRRTPQESPKHDEPSSITDAMPAAWSQHRTNFTSSVGVATAPQCKHNASMPNVLIRDVPDEVHASLQQRAEAAGQSLQQYLSNELSRIARSPTLDDVLARIERHQGGRIGFATAVTDLHDERTRS